MNLQHLRYLAAFAESRTLTGAAESLGISQPAISRALRELQDELQCVLFRRTGRRLEFTKEGKAVLEATRRALAAIEDIRRVVPEQDGKAMLRIASFQSMAAGLSSILERFLRARPNIQVQVIHADEQEKMIEMLRRRDIDVAYGEMVRPPRGLSLTPMEPLEIVLLSPPETDLPAQVQIEHIGKIPMICPPPSEERRRLLDAPLAAMGLKMNVVLESDDPTTFPAGVRSGIGSSVAWRQIAEQSPGVEMRCFQPPRKLPVGFIHHPKPSAAVRLLLSLAERSAGASTTKQQAALAQPHG